MKKSIRMSVKPLAMATAFAAGTSVSMIATALPGGDTLDARGVVNETICQRSVDMTISGGARSITTGTGTCQLRTLPPTKSFVLANSAPAGSTVVDSSAMVNAGGELYESYVNGDRDAAVLLTPNRALATSRSVFFAAGNAGAASFSLAAAVQPSTGLQSSWLTGTYTIVNRNHNFQLVASGLEQSPSYAPNPALGSPDYTKSMSVSFNGDGTCAINNIDSHSSFTLTKDPLFIPLGEMGVTCFDGGGYCGQNDGDNYLMAAAVNTGTTSGLAPLQDETDWGDADASGTGLIASACTYAVAPGKVTVNYETKYGTLSDVPNMTTNAWSVTYDVSADLRYIVSDGDSLTDYASSGRTDGTLHDEPQRGGIAVGVRTGATSLTGKTYLFNAMDSTYASSTASNSFYENPLSPVYQSENCLTRGSLTLQAGGACTVNRVSTCVARNKNGYEETAAGAGDGTITDNITTYDGIVPTTGCSWSGTASDLHIALNTVDQDNNPITMQFTGSASDNGEALVMQGIYNVTAPAPDVDNPPLLTAQKYNMLSYMVAQEYQGDLTADADADGLDNLGEFQWADGYIRGDRNDFTADLVGDIYWYRPTDAGLDKPAGGTQVWEMFGNKRARQLYPGNMTDLSLVPAALGDLNKDGLTDVVFHNDSTGLNVTWISTNNWDSLGKGGKAVSSLPSTAPGYTVAGLGDFDGDGDADVLVHNATTGEAAVWVIEDPMNCVSGACRKGESYLPVMNPAFSVAGIGDFDHDGVDDIYWFNRTTGEGQIWKMQTSSRVAVSYLPVLGNLNYKPVGVADTDGDGDMDIVLHNQSTGQVQIWVIQDLQRVATSYPPALPNTYSYAGSADFNSDGTQDILWRIQSTGANKIWSMRHNKKYSETNLEAGHPALVPVF